MTFRPANKAELMTALEAKYKGLGHPNEPVDTYNLWDTSLVTNMHNLLGAASLGDTLFNENISTWDTSAVTDMSNMFENFSSFNQDISGWSVSSVTNMSYMFKNTTAFNQDISRWTVSSVTDMNHMFAGSPGAAITFFDQDLSAWKTRGGLQSGCDLTSMFEDSYMNIVNGVPLTPIYANWETTVNCFYGFVNIMTNKGLKQIKDLKRGDLIQTNDGFQPLAKLMRSFNPSDELLLKKINTTNYFVKIPQNYFKKDLPSEDVYVSKFHSISLKILSDENDKDFEYLHLNVDELVSLGGGIEYVRMLNEKKIYNLVFDNHYEINIGGIKFLSHHPNHFNGNNKLKYNEAISLEKRSKKIIADKNGTYNKIITLDSIKKNMEKFLKDKGKKIKNKFIIRSLSKLIKFNNLKNKIVTN